MDIDKMLFGFIPGCRTTNVIFTLRKLQENYLPKQRNLCLAFLDLEEAFDGMSRDVVLWVLRKLRGEYLITIEQSMYMNP